MKRIILPCACAAAITALPASEPVSVVSDAQAAESVSASKAPKRFRAGYARWRNRLQRYDLYVGRDLLPQVQASDGSSRPPTKRELRRSIHRMQKRWARFTRTTRRGRNAMFKFKVRRGVPRWGKQYLRNIAWCESRRNPRAIGGGGAYRGMYQFSVRTWYVVGGRGDPAAAPRHEQTWRACC
jgi:hypothetical protein